MTTEGAGGAGAEGAGGGRSRARRADRTPGGDRGAAERAFRLLPAAPRDLPPPSGRAHTPARRISSDPDTVERDLIRLVLTVVELLRQLMERQALHRVDEGDLTEEQEERLGATLMVLHERMSELCAQYGLAMEDLNLDLGPLGTLLPPSD
ncbi:gas vesicle protein K [Streptomyces luteolus]|uniref:Gas vesicle protein K n=1 Tax=Streptomyces luteolus TaxID=3043615 RepID=A0ABT6SU11_9ACTN|nr:gas vesicle protein K [Streptomyces sp. B-S-A12]MDI3419100.1 gas vesicle protein K [Streptomyces sp. B-S-A12]